jgi:ABC-2 type transport system permease protein
MHFFVLLLGCAYIAIGMFISSLTESQIIAAIGTLAVLLLTYFMSDITGFLGTTAFASMISFVVLVVLAALIYHYMTKNKLVSVIIGVVGIAVLLVLYFLKQDIFVNLMPSFLNALSPSGYIADYSYQTFELSTVYFTYRQALFLSF